jgi:hypothetical protein
VDLRKAYPLEADTYCYVMDSHRPYSHYNILPSSDQVIVLGDDFLNLQTNELPAESDEEHMQSDSDDSDSDDASHDDKDNSGRCVIVCLLHRIRCAVCVRCYIFRCSHDFN